MLFFVAMDVGVIQYDWFKSLCRRLFDAKADWIIYLAMLSIMILASLMAALLTRPTIATETEAA